MERIPSRPESGPALGTASVQVNGHGGWTFTAHGGGYSQLFCFMAVDLQQYQVTSIIRSMIEMICAVDFTGPFHLVYDVAIADLIDQDYLRQHGVASFSFQ